jgi:hypothetical protein
VSAVGGNAENAEENVKSADADNADKPAEAVNWDGVNEALMEAASAEEKRWTL